MASTMTKLKDLHITFEDIAKATKTFHDKKIIGHGGFGTTTYKGKLLPFGKIAARRFDCNHVEGDLRFLTEISILSHLKHTNLVSIIGYCDEQNEKIIVTAYESNGSLGEHLNNPNLTWTQRLKISINVARALCHLEGGDYGVIHCNINSDTIFLNENWEAKLSGFEISIKQSACYKDQGVLCEHTGRIGYTDPTIENKGGIVTHKSDIYSFGIVLFEILCGRKAFIQKEADMFLAPLAKCQYENQTLRDIIFPDLVISPQSLLKYSAIAYSCINDDPACRPNMNYITSELEEALKLQQPFQYAEENLKHLKIPFTQIEAATGNFSPAYITQSGPGYTFYGAELHRFDKQNPSYVDIRCIFNGQEENFIREIEVRSRVKHNNIVPLTGFCVEASEMILFTEICLSGTLYDYFQNYEKRRILTWENRLKICIDVAYALNHVHSKMEEEKAIMHCDLSSYNIGVDENMRAKIIIFDCVVFTPRNQEDIALHLNWLSKQSYLDPESKETYKLKKHYDVYSFGVLLFEIMRGMIINHPVYLMELEGKERHVTMVTQHLCTGTLEKITDPLIKEEYLENNFFLKRRPDKDSLHKFIRIAHRCMAAKSHDQRPTMEFVVKELENALFLHKKNPIIPLEDIKQATQNFHDDNCIGGKGFGKIYKGNLQVGDGPNTIITKRFETRLDQGEKQFFSELQILWEYKHENVIGLVGYCDEQDEKVIVYEFACRGSLDQYLSDASLTWMKRLNICIDVANALDFIHGGVGKQTKVIHGDIKSENILLNQHWKAKLADFGLSIINPITLETECVINYACGTQGYMDPLYEKSGCLTIKSDIYSFGVVLFEMLCGRSTFAIHDHEGHYLPEFIKSIFEKEKHDEVVFEQIREQIKPKSLTIFQKIAYQCLHYEAEKRPTAKQVLKQLKKALKFQKKNPTIPLEDIKQATQNFHDDNCIGGKGFGKIYKGNLQVGDGSKTIITKRFETRLGQGEKQFLSELQIHLEYKHENVIGLEGYCDEQDEKVVVYEFACRGSLDQYLRDASLTWMKRLNICIDVANALDFIHGGVGKQTKVIHGDIKSENILLNQRWKAKLADFGLSIINPITLETECVINYACGTQGYMDPLYEKSGCLTIQSDIYSFGVVLFEMLCGRSTFAIYDHEGHYLPEFIKSIFEKEKHDEVVFEQIREQIKPKSLTIFQKIAYQCLHYEADKRPTAKQVLKQLKKALKFQISKDQPGRS